MKKINRIIAIVLSVLLLAAAFCMTACKDDKKPSNPATTTANPKPGKDTVSYTHLTLPTSITV